MTLIDTLAEMKGGFVFNEVNMDMIEFRFYLDQILDDSARLSANHNFLVVGSQTHLA